MEDPSVDTRTLDRKEILARLNLKPSSSFTTIDLKTKLNEPERLSGSKREQKLQN